MLYDEHKENVNKITDKLFGEKKASQKLYDVLVAAYPSTIIVNSEMFNKNNVNASYIKATRNVVDCILSEQEVNKVYQSQTSPEITVYNAFNIEKKDISEIVNHVISIIEHSEGKKVNVNKVVNALRNKPYGIRKGVIPLIFAYAIASFRKDHVLVYLQNKEIGLAGSTLIEFANEEKDYSLVLEKGSADQVEYLNGLIKLFNGKAGKTFQESVSNTVLSIRNWVLSLPPIVRDVISHRYNTQFKMIRFFRNYYFEENEFNNLASFTNVFNNEQADGLIVNVIRESELSDAIENKFNSIDDNRTLLNISSTNTYKLGDWFIQSRYWS